MIGAIIGIGTPILVIAIPTFLLATYLFVHQKESRERYESFERSPKSFKSLLWDSYGLIVLIGFGLAIYYLGVNAWSLANGNRPSDATPFIAMVATAVAMFALFASSMGALAAVHNLRQARLASAAQIICYLTRSNDTLVIRLENASSSSAAYDVTAVICDEDTSNYDDPTSPCLGKGTVIATHAVFPPASYTDFELSRADTTDKNKPLAITVHLEWTGFHGQRLGGAFQLDREALFHKTS